jgi:hypothetical protein
MNKTKQIYKTTTIILRTAKAIRYETNEAAVTFLYSVQECALNELYSMVHFLNGEK